MLSLPNLMVQPEDHGRPVLHVEGGGGRIHLSNSFLLGIKPEFTSINFKWLLQFLKIIFRCSTLPETAAKQLSCGCQPALSHTTAVPLVQKSQARARSFS